MATGGRLVVLALAPACALLAIAAAAAAAAADPVLDRATPAERALLTKVDAQLYVKARDEAQAILAANPRSFPAAWAMALVEHDEEGNHARALYWVRQARDLLLAQLGPEPTWHKKVWLEEIQLLHEMDRNLEVLAALDRFQARYGPGHEELRIWPLFKLGRGREAREIAVRLAASDSWSDRASGYNGMLAIELEAHDRAATYRWSVDAVRATQERSCVILRNAAEAAVARFRLDEAEDFALRAHKAEVHDCSLSGYDQLAALYIVEGEFQKALSAIETMKGEHIIKRYRPHYALTRRTILSDLLYALGKVEDAERMAGELYGLPERTGMVSNPPAVERFARSHRYFAALDARLLLLTEKASYRPLFARASLETARLALSEWEVRRALIQLASDEDLLTTFVRPDLADIGDLAPWRVGGLIEVLGSGVLKAVVARARALDAGFPEAAAYYDAFAGEIAFREGDLESAVRLAGAAVAGLPRQEAMIRWRTLAWQADALRQLGRARAADPAYHEVMQKLPSVMRVLDLRVPASLWSDGSALGRAALGRLAGSRRFLTTAGEAPFQLRASDRGGALEVCLVDARGGQLACATGEKRPQLADTVLSGLDAFHAEAFSPRVALKQTDISSLDGSPMRVSADQVLKGVLEP
jgi:hypothetical protein